jgi:CMP-N,N'-diacetyllegionaminic acid synthase
LKKALSILGLIPARAGSKRVTGKNIRELAGTPLIAYTISAAINSGIFSKIIVSTEDEKIADIAKKFGAKVPFLRPLEYAQDDSADIDWIQHLLQTLEQLETLPDCFAILRPTSPFRKPETIQRAWNQFLSDPSVDSLRAIEKCSQHPAKMWEIDGNRMAPILKNTDVLGTPWHSMPYQSLPPIYVQNASLEIAYCQIPLNQKTIAGEAIMPFITNGYEGFDINLPEDWYLAEHLIQNKQVQLPPLIT